MKRISLRKLLPWLVVAVVVAFAVYRLKFSPMPVMAYTICMGEVRGEVMGTGRTFGEAYAKAQAGAGVVALLPGRGYRGEDIDQVVGAVGGAGAS